MNRNLKLCVIVLSCKSTEKWLISLNDPYVRIINGHPTHCTKAYVFTKYWIIFPLSKCSSFFMFKYNFLFTKITEGITKTQVITYGTISEQFLVWTEVKIWKHPLKSVKFLPIVFLCLNRRYFGDWNIAWIAGDIFSSNSLSFVGDICVGSHSSWFIVWVILSIKNINQFIDQTVFFR